MASAAVADNFFCIESDLSDSSGTGNLQESTTSEGLEADVYEFRGDSRRGEGQTARVGLGSHDARGRFDPGSQADSE